MTILEQIIEAKRRDIEALYQDKGLAYFEKEAAEVSEAPSFYEALKQGPNVSLIAEIKKASPSKGVIREGFDPLEIVATFEPYATCLSVLTEPHFFMGSTDILKAVSAKTAHPILRKDFIIDPIQLYEAKCIGASAILVILAITTDEAAQRFLDIAADIGLDVLVEVHSDEEYTRFKQLQGKMLLGINNRDLATFDTDITRGQRLAMQAKKELSDVLVVVESGYQHIDELASLYDIDAVLIGEGLANNPDLLTYFTNSPPNPLSWKERGD